MTDTKKKWLGWGAAGALLLLAGCSNESTTDNGAELANTAQPQMASLDEPVSTSAGQITGVAAAVEGVRAFKGIPFGAPPLGALRWQPPQPVAAWEGQRSGADYGPACMQASQPQRQPNNVSVDLADSPPMSEDCLYLNVWTPADNADADLPVMVWIYGGAYTEGAGSTPHNQGDRLAAKDVVVVTFNYRLGSLGFLAHPELTAESAHGASGNYALADALEALRWVQENIAGFGGDPDNVTLFGESAGAAMTAALVGSPVAEGLFHRAIAESGTWMGLGMDPMRSRESAEQQTLAVATEIGANNLADLRNLSAEEARTQLPAQGMIIDGWIIPEDLSVTFAEGRQNAVDVIAGTNRDEGSFLGGFGPPMSADSWQSSAEDRWGDLAELGLQAYPAESDEVAADYTSRSFTDTMTWTMRLFAEHQRDIGQGAWVYQFVHEPPYADESRNIGACHACEIAYVFDNLDKPRVYPDASSPEMAQASEDDRRVADLMSSYWASFARDGDPNEEGLPPWPAFQSIEEGPVLHIDATPEVGDSLSPAKLRLYSERYERQIAQ